MIFDLFLKKLKSKDMINYWKLVYNFYKKIIKMKFVKKIEIFMNDYPSKIFDGK